jgi:hypothetical protein
MRGTAGRHQDSDRLCWTITVFDTAFGAERRRRPSPKAASLLLRPQSPTFAHGLLRKSEFS